MKNDTDKLLIEGIPDKVKMTFKAACAKRGVSMKAAILKFMKDFSRGKDNMTQG